MDVESVIFDTPRDDFIHIFIFSRTGDLFYCSMFLSYFGFSCLKMTR